MSGQHVTIRAATRADLDTLLAIDAAIDVAVMDQQVAGYLCSWLICGELQIQNLATSPPFRRRGVGQMLLNYVIERSCQQGLLSAWLEVREDNQAAIHLYLASGFEVQGRRKKYYQDGEDALLLGRNFE